MSNERASHVPLVGEPAVGSDLRQACAAADRRASTFDADLSQPFMWCHPVRPFEATQQLIFAQPDEGRELGERRRVSQIIGHAFARS